MSSSRTDNQKKIQLIKKILRNIKTANFQQ